MAPSASKANYKSYEAQARLVRAIVAAHPTTKWNYKDIAKYFGQSTADGIQFQFRAIKKDADKMRATADSGDDPSTCVDLGSAAAFTPSSTPKTPRSRSVTLPASGTGGGSSTAKRGRPVALVKIEDDDDDEDSASSQNWSEMEATPSKRPRKHDALSGQKPGATPSRLAATKASAAFAEQQQSSESESEVSSLRPGRQLPTHVRNGTVRPSPLATAAAATGTPPPTAPRPSLFGDVSGSHHESASSFGNNFLGGGGGGGFGGLSADNPHFDDDEPIDGEI